MSKKRTKSGPLVPAAGPPDTAKLLQDLRDLIEAGRGHVAQAVNAGMVRLYWSVGDRIRREILGERRAKYGEQIVEALARELTAQYGRGFGRRNLFQMVRFAEAFPDGRIVQTLSAQLGWRHFVELLPIDDPLKRDFYAEMCRLERWSVRTLRARIGGMLFERTAIAKKPDEMARREIAALGDEDRLTAAAAAAAGVTVISRLRRDAALRTVPVPPRAGRRRRGRPPIDGAGRISLAKRAGQRRGWRLVQARQYGEVRLKRVKTFAATWPPAGGRIRVVLVQEDHGWLALFSTDPALTAAAILSAAADRFSSEQDFHDLKEVDGLGQQQVRNI